jgi:HPt (histidine-containing phosphotransfer) domain-containing protein
MEQNNRDDAAPLSDARSRLMHGVIDEGVWDDLRALRKWSEPDMVTKIMTSYIDSSSKLLDGLSDMASAGDATSLRDAARRLRFSSAGLGATALASLCRELEGLEQGAFEARAVDLLCGIQDEFSRVRGALEHELRWGKV